MDADAPLLFSPDPFERNLGRFRKTPNEGTLFYGLQDCNDMWMPLSSAVQCAVIRCKPLDEIGGIAVEMRNRRCAHFSASGSSGLWVTPQRICVFPHSGAGDLESLGAYRSAYSLAAWDGANLPSR